MHSHAVKIHCIMTTATNTWLQLSLPDRLVNGADRVGVKDAVYMRALLHSEGTGPHRTQAIRRIPAATAFQSLSAGSTFVTSPAMRSGPQM